MIRNIIIIAFVLYNINAVSAKSLKVYKHIDKDGIIHYSSKKPDVKNYRIIHAESSFKADIKSSVGAQGLMQLMPATQKIYSVTNPYSPSQNIQAGTAYLKHLLKTYDNNLRLSLAAYNAGEGAVKKYDNNVPPYKETENYIKRVKILHKRYKLNQTKV